MFNLVRNELTKIFSKKGIYIILIIFAILSSLILAIEKYGANAFLETITDYNIEYVQEQMTMIDTNTKEGKEQYISLQAELELYKLAMNYGGHSTWQGQMIYEEIWPIKMDLVMYENELDPSGKYTTYSKEELEQEYAKIIERIEKGDWKSFVQEDLKEIQDEIAMLEQTLKTTTEAETKKELNKNLETLKIEEQCNKWRLEKEIPYNDSKYEDALFGYTSSGTLLIENNYKYDIDETNYKEKDPNKFNYSAKVEYQNNLENFKISKYRIENAKPNLAGESASYILEGFVSGIGLLFIIIIAIMLAASTVSDEFNKGTIKLLLIRPYTRRKIMLSKVIALVIAIIISIIALILIQTVEAGIGYGFNTVGEPIIKYNFDTNSVVEMNVFVWLAINLLCVSPIIIILATIALMVGTIITNASSAIALGMLTYMGSNILQAIVMAYGSKITWIRYIPFINWDLTQVLHGRLPQIEGVTLPVAIISCSILAIILLTVTFENFARKNVKNI